MPKVIAVVGPTATGKSDLAVAVAQHLGADVVNGDAYQLYRGMDIGTAKLAPSERGGITHHLLDLVEPDTDLSVAWYRQTGQDLLQQLAAAQTRSVVAGGSGLYLRALLDRMVFPATDPQLRAALQERAQEQGPGLLHQELARLDPQAAALIDSRNSRRVVRALEVCLLTGHAVPGDLPRYQYEIPAVQIGLEISRRTLDQIITARVDRMWDAGLVAEVESLQATGLSATAQRAVGYAQVLQFLAGDLDAEQARESTVIATRRLARKQMGWFGRDPRVHWLRADDDNLLEQALALVERADRGELLESAQATRRVLPD